MTKRIVIVKWNRAGEDTGAREIVFELETPVRRETDRLEDAILQLPVRKGIAFGECAGEEAGEDHESRGECTWYIPAGTRLQAPTPQEVLEFLQAEPARRQAAAAAKRAERVAGEQADLDRRLANLLDELAVPPAERQGRGTYVQSMCIPSGCPAGVAVQAEAYQAELRKIAASNKVTADVERTEKEQAKEARAQRRREYIASWAAVHGSERLQAQVAAGMEGWPLYLHERLAADLGEDAELDNDGSDPEPLINPSLEQMVAAADLASRLLACGQVEKGEVAIRKVTVAKITFEPDEDDPYPVVLTYTCCDWTPGDPELFAVHSVRVACVD